VSGIGNILRAVVREKAKADGVTWRRLHRCESILTLAEGRIRALPGKRRRSRRPKLPAEAGK